MYLHFTNTESSADRQAIADRWTGTFSLNLIATDGQSSSALTIQASCSDQAGFDWLAAMLRIIVIVNYLLRKLCGYLPLPLFLESTDNWQHARTGKNVGSLGKLKLIAAVGATFWPAAAIALCIFMLLLKSFSFCFSASLVVVIVLVAGAAAAVAVADAVFGTLIWSVHGEKPPSTASQRQRRPARQRQTTLSCHLALGLLCRWCRN